MEINQVSSHSHNNDIFHEFKLHTRCYLLFSLNPLSFFQRNIQCIRMYNQKWHPRCSMVKTQVSLNWFESCLINLSAIHNGTNKITLGIYLVVKVCQRNLLTFKVNICLSILWMAQLFNFEQRYIPYMTLYNFDVSIREGTSLISMKRQ